MLYTMPFAFVFAMFLGDSYLPGVLIMGYSIKLTNTIHDIVCMVTPDVSEAARAKMRSVGIVVAPVEYLTTKIQHKDKNRAVLKRYPNIHLFITKWQCLSLVQYDKVFLLDVDMIVQRNIDHVFTYPTPSAKVCVASGKSFKCQDTGSIVTAKTVDKILQQRGGGADGGCMLLKPGVAEYKAFTEYLTVFDVNTYNTTMPDDELAIFSFYVSHNISWHALDSKWSCVHWKAYDSCNSTNSNIMNYIGTEKPWIKDLSKYADLKKWYETYHRFKVAHPTLL